GRHRAAVEHPLARQGRGRGPEGACAVTCCGREMRNENGVLVCGKCGSSYQSSTTSRKRGA
ncbi:hypothetical protein ACM6RM_16680, partial [Streptomyces pratensis]